MLPKRRILELYLNVIEWGSGVFGAEAAAQRYFGVSAAELSAEQSARLAAMAPSPRVFEKRPGSAYLSGRVSTILARMPAAAIP
jgi:monofunctional biosynthetic peptidoglycan transglycosylase